MPLPSASVLQPLKTLRSGATNEFLLKAAVVPNPCGGMRVPSRPPLALKLTMAPVSAAHCAKSVVLDGRAGPAQPSGYFGPPPPGLEAQCEKTKPGRSKVLKRSFTFAASCWSFMVPVASDAFASNFTAAVLPQTAYRTAS